MLLLFGYGLYLHSMHKQKELFVDLKQTVDLLENQLAKAQDKREDLLLEIDSQSDPAWIEMLLKKHLGMVPFGQTKVYFDTE